MTRIDRVYVGSEGGPDTIAQKFELGCVWTGIGDSDSIPVGGVRSADYASLETEEEAAHSALATWEGCKVCVEETAIPRS